MHHIKISVNAITLLSSLLLATQTLDTGRYCAGRDCYSDCEQRAQIELNQKASSDLHPCGFRQLICDVTVRQTEGVSC